MALLHSSTVLPPPYVYKPLPTTPATIRLIKIHSETSSFDDPVFCEIHHVSLDAASGYGYTGLSYVWGEPIFDQTIYCDGRALKVTSHLHEAMQMLRGRRVSWVWIDAICIDQSSIAERNAQVSIMGRIFKQTKMTYAYLGKMDEDSEQVAGLIVRLAFLNLLFQARSRRDLEFMRNTDIFDEVSRGALQNHPCASEREKTWFSQWRQYCMAIFELREVDSQEEIDRVLKVLGLPVADSRIWRSCKNFFGRSAWFGRGWVIQEAVLSPHVRFVLGSEPVDLADLARSLWFSQDSGLNNIIGIDSNKLNTSKRELLPYMAGVMMGTRKRIHSRQLKQILRSFRWCETADPRDKIYSLLGLAEDLDTSAPKPDYHQSKENVFLSYATYMVQHQQDLDILLDAGISRGSTQKSGTWVPQWDEWWPPFTLLPMTYRASGSAKSVFSHANDSSLLVRGVFFDKLGQLAMAMTVDETPRTWERRVSNIVKKTPRLSTESYAKALVADFCSLGMKHFSDPSIHTWTYTDMYERALAGQPTPETLVYLEVISNFHMTLTFVLTHKGKLGWVPWCTEEGDLICIVFGVQMPLVIREVEHGRYILIGAAYIEGIMEGEAFEETNLEGEDITLV